MYSWHSLIKRRRGAQRLHARQHIFSNEIDDDREKGEAHIGLYLQTRKYSALFRLLELYIRISNRCLRY